MPSLKGRETGHLCFAWLHDLHLDTDTSQQPARRGSTPGHGRAGGCNGRSQVSTAGGYPPVMTRRATLGDNCVAIVAGVWLPHQTTGASPPSKFTAMPLRYEARADRRKLPRSASY